jgi:hypothetical protein
MSSIDFAEISRQDLDQAGNQDYIKNFEKGLSEDLIRQNGNRSPGYRHKICPVGKYIAGFKTYAEGDWPRTGHFQIYCRTP